jgi:hypothetical protein
MSFFVFLLLSFSFQHLKNDTKLKNFVDDTVAMTLPTAQSK